MTFAEKLSRLTEDRHKNRVSIRAGLPGSAISDYIAKGHTPRADTALALARVLGVSLDWLVDNRLGWPPVLVNSAAVQVATPERKDRKRTKQVA